MYKFTRFFSIASALAIIAVIVLLAVLFRQNALNELVKTSELHNAALGRAFANTIWPKYSDYVKSVDAQTGDALRTRPETAALHRALKSIAYELPVLKIKIYNLNGLTIYSSQADQIGQSKIDNLGYLDAARNGKPASKFSFRKSFSTFSGTSFDRHVVESYIPIRDLSGPVEGVFELYADVTSLIDNINRSTRDVVISLIAILGTLYGFLFLIVRRASRIMKRQYTELQRSEVIEEKNRALESEISERQRVEDELRQSQEALTQLHEITAGQQASPTENIQKIIELGRKIFGLPMGIVGKVVGDTYVFAHIYGPPGSPSAGTTLPMADTYCQHAFKANEPVAIENVSQSALSKEICYEKLGLEAYVGTPVYVDGRRYGTLCFASPDARSEPFSDGELSLIKLFASWIGGEIQRDVTHAAITESEQKFRTVMENAADAILVHDLEGRFVQVNGIACSSLGYTRDELMDLPVSAIEVGNSPEDLEAIFEQIGSEEPRTFQGVHRRKNGTTFPIEARISLANWDGAENVVVIARDMTSRQQAENALLEGKEAAENASIAKSHFLASASHDLRQPLQALNLFIEVLKRSKDEAKRQDTLVKLEGSVGDLGNLLNALLDVSKLEAGLVVPDLKDFEVDDLFTFSDEFRSVAAAKGIEFRLVSSSAVIHSDPRLLEAILRNLIANALKYTASGKVLVGCRRHGSNLRIEVHDTGIGISAEHRTRIFEEFYQVGNEARDRDQGLGLGLSIVDRTVKLMDHVIDVSSTPGKGSMFAVEVPLGTNVNELSNRDLPGQGLSLTDKSLVVIVDDDISVLEGLEALLTEMGCSVVKSNCSGDLRQEIGNLVAGCYRTPDIILADYRLPGGRTGIDVVGGLRAAFSHHVPAILLTGEISKDFLLESRRDDFRILHKPANAEKLALAMQEVQETAPTPSAEIIPIFATVGDGSGR